MKPPCVVGIAAYSGTGKTTLIEQLLPLLKQQGLAVAVVKHCHHLLEIDARGKDTDRFFRAGADHVFAHDPTQLFGRSRSGDQDLARLLERIPADVDVVLVEGHKESQVPGLWLEETSASGPEPDRQITGRQVIFRDDPAYADQALAFIMSEVERTLAVRPVYAGLLVGGKSSRMGRSKALLKIKGKTLAERSVETLFPVSGKVVLLGNGSLPQSLDGLERLPDVPAQEGPIAGILSAFRWAPQAAWIMSSVDMPLMTPDAWHWLLSQRRPGVWAVLPKIPGRRGVETTGAIYEPMIFEYMELLANRGVTKLQDIAEHPRVFTPSIPERLIPAWKNVNTPEEWDAVSSGTQREIDLTGKDQ